MGTDMRQQAMQLMRGVHRAVDEPACQPEHVGALVWLVDNYKLTLQLAMEVGAFTHGAEGTSSFAGFEKTSTLAGKGSHTAVDRLKHFIRKHNGAGWYLQLDFHNFFNTIHRPSLYAMLCKRLDKSDLKPNHAFALRSLCHKLLANKVTEQVRDPAAAVRLPAHKRLANALPGCGLPVGNLTSQFFAHLYLNALDQFVKRTLQCKHYVRYSDDFVLIAKTPEQLRDWQAQKEQFLDHTLRQKLKNAVSMHPLCRRIDFFGCRVFVGHRRVRPRVVQHCKTKLADWAAQHVKQAEQGITIHANSTALAPLQAATPGATSTAMPARVRAVQTGWLRHGTRRREITHWFIPHPIPLMI